MNQNLTIPPELHTLQDMVRWGSSQLCQFDVFLGNGNDNAIDESMALLLYITHLDPGIPDNFWAANLTATEKQSFVKLLQRRITDRVPMPYLTKNAWFAEIAFYVDKRVLIPRSAFAELIQTSFEPWINIDSETPFNILELGTGSGCISIATALYLPNNIAIDAIDISSDALEVAALNIATYHLENIINLLQGDLFDPLTDQKYQLIISNPPYVDAAEMAALPDEYRHEPSLALAAGHDGLSIVHRLLKQARNYLTDDGILIVEVGDSEVALINAYPDLDFIWLDFKKGGSGIFVLNKKQLQNYYD